MTPNDHCDNVYDDNPDDNEDTDYADEHPESNAKLPPHTPAEDSLNIMSTNVGKTNSASQAAIAATFRGCCCELFVLGKCSKSNCTNDQSALYYVSRSFNKKRLRSPLKTTQLDRQ